MPRLFTALEVPRNVAACLSLLKGGLPGARWIDAENYHVTLQFIGDVSGRQANDLAEALDGVRAQQIILSVSGLAVFGSKKPHGLIAAINPDLALTALHADTERLCQRLGLHAEARKYVPHITLARLKNTSAQEAAFYLSQHGLISIPDFSASRFVLMSSRDSVGGGPYAIEAVYPLLEVPVTDLSQNQTAGL